MRAVLKSANGSTRGADLSRVDGRASLKALTFGASHGRCSGANLTGVTVIDTDFDGADLDSAKLIAPDLDQARNFDKAKNRDRLVR
jgi:uncharacterized protein YjbI with pentapeptide repeats